MRAERTRTFSLCGRWDARNPRELVAKGTDYAAIWRFFDLLGHQLQPRYFAKGALLHECQRCGIKLLPSFIISPCCRLGPPLASRLNRHVETDDIILLLVSSDFLDSDYCYEKEMARAMQRHEAGEKRS